MAPLVGCGSSAQFESMQYQLAEIQAQIRQLQKDSARQSQLEEVRLELAAELEALQTAQAATDDDIERIGERISLVRDDISNAGREVATLRDQLAAAEEELAALELAVVAAAETPDPQSDDTSTMDPQDLYQSSYDHFLRGNYADAINGFERYVDRFPNSELADNATYWIGESYFSQGSFDQAVRAFGRVASLYPNSERIASSLLREGSARIELGDRARGRRALMTVVERYPQSDEAILARQQLDRLPG